MTWFEKAEICDFSNECLASKLLPIGDQPLPEQHFCLYLNVSQCEPTETLTRFVATVYNPRSSEATTYVRLPVVQGSYVVLDPDG